MTDPRCPICGEIFDLDDDKQEEAKRSRDVHMDWCWDVELARKRLKLGLPLPEGITPQQSKAARERLPENPDPVQTSVDDW